jgi:uncharacterized paraquat-inducible protein A
MTLDEAIELGNACGLLTAEECVDNVIMHALSLFVYDEMETELSELQEEWEANPEYPTHPRELADCVKCEGATWHRQGACLRCKCMFFDHTEV